jgi:transposase-like protein
MDTFDVVCPYCHETVEVDLESDVEGSLVYDCEVCCQPWLLTLKRRHGQAPTVGVQRAQ